MGFAVFIYVKSSPQNRHSESVKDEKVYFFLPAALTKATKRGLGSSTVERYSG